ncbi:hypothetical protein OPV22_006121 [Ensete ventricosum]|uniref:DC1 domain-containing protein n=1 Tax=Ensete ventricosum TaxID=4639 RepID=A0AAV8RQL3_ENSVE|nr:hypothetical protein OPV22_006121 [Ensete ventricosum]
MGRLGYDPRINHFSHPHPLELASLQQSLTPPTCAGCTFRASGWAYSCKACNYTLHISCAEMPQRIRHPAHPQHSLTLLTVPTYKEGSFNCDACGRDGAGFSYHCEPCGVDLHSMCASMPLSVSHGAHEHPLSLVFSVPYENNGFSCDLCGGMGSSHWLYRCAMCEFDAHIGCATAKMLQAQPSPPPTLPPRHTVPRPRTLQQQTLYPVGVGMGVSNGVWQGGVPVGYPRMPRRGRGSGGLITQVVRGFVTSAAQQIGQSLMQNILEGGGGDGSGGGDGGSTMDVGSGVGDSFFGSDE